MSVPSGRCLPPIFPISAFSSLHAFLVAVLLCGLIVTASAATLRGEVVGLADGDTLTVLDNEHHQHRVRLVGIDAPEKRQAFGERSRQHLSALVFRQEVVVDWKKRDRYGRILGVVRVRSVDVGQAQLRAGLAWHYKAYAREQPAAQRTLYSDEEVDARRARRGLWSEAAPTPPWEFRRSKVTGARAPAESPAYR
ncbi:thermonuclease family protein [Roseateles chitinivorans]|uniref:thermonuclease family protein n=1 Tax=Roseateles chitinivorans TaxID=2917965 RepID=UPI003D667397